MRYTFGVSYQANSHLLLAFEARAQFHGAEKTGNLNQTVIATLTRLASSPRRSIVVPFGWQNSWSAKIGFEYRFTKDFLALQIGHQHRELRDDRDSSPSTSRRPRPLSMISTGSAGLGFLLGRPERSRASKTSTGSIIAGLFSIHG